MTRWLLRRFGKAQRPIAWTILIGGLVTFFAVLFDIVVTGEAKVGTLLAAILVINDGFQSAQAVENELDTEGAAEE